MIVTIDGPAGTGKSTIAQRVARLSGLLYVNSGSLYRAITYACFQEFSQNLHELIKNDGSRIVQLAHTLHLSLSDRHVLMNGRNLSDIQLRSDVVDRYVAQISSIPEIRTLVNAELIRITQTRDVIAEGRDMSTVVFPDAELQFYFDASIEARAKRRHQQGTSTMDIASIEQSIAERDAIDKSKKIGALKQSEQAIYLDTSDLTIEQVCEIVLKSIRQYKNQSGVYS